MTYFSQWLKEDFPNLYAQVTHALDKHGEAHGVLPHTKDYWCRDYMPIPLADGSYLRYRYYPDYLRNKKRYITESKEVCEVLGLKCIDTDIILDGGNVVRCGDKVVMIDKIFNENPHYSPSALMAKLEQLLGAEIVLLPWDRAEKYGHSDGITRYLGEGKVLLTNYNDYSPKMHERFFDVLSKSFQVEVLNYTHPDPNDESWAYINYLQTPRVILLPKLGIDKDTEALTQFKDHFHHYEGRIEQIDTSDILAKGGALNCISWSLT